MVYGENLKKSDYLDNECKKIIIHKKLAENIFLLSEEAVGRTISICTYSGKSYEFLVSGVYENNVSDYQTQSSVYGSYKTISELLNQNDKISKYFVQAGDIRKISELKLHLSDIMRNRYQIDDYKYIIIVSDIIKSIDIIIGLVSSVFLIFSCLIFIVSGINIRNVLLSIMEHYTHLIGIQKAIGAYDRVILMEYMMQGVIVSCIGTFISIGSFFAVISVINENNNEICKFISDKTNMDFFADITLNLSIDGTDICVSLILSCVIVIICCYSSIKSSISMNIVDSLRK